MNKHVKNQHYVPQFLLRNFSSRDEKFIWTYDKNKVYNLKYKILERTIKKVASEEFFYDQIRNSKIGSYEYILQITEDLVAPIISKIIKTKNIKDLSKVERETISHFIILQFLRTKGELNKTEFYMNKLYDEIKRKTNIEIKKNDPKEIWFSVLGDASKFVDKIMNKVWHLAESNESFYISDNPVTLQNSTVKSDIIGTLGLDSYGIEIYLPLSHSLTLCLFCEKLFEEKGYNLKYIENGFCEPENIENLNSLQVAFGERFIFSNKNNFDFVINQIKNAL